METVIAPGRGTRHQWQEVWRHRELFLFLAWRDLLVRYKQTAIGIAWSVIRPALTIVVFWFVFGRIAKLPSEGVPYPLFVFAAMLPWQLFAGGLVECSDSLIANSNLLTKIYFPRIIIPASSLVVALADGLITLVLFCVVAPWFGLVPGWQVLAIPFLFVLVVLCTFGFGASLAALNARYRDFRYVVPFLVQVGLYVSPVGFSSSIVPEQWRALYWLNPVVGIIDGFRWALFGGRTPLDWRSVAVSAVVSFAAFLGGTRYFRRWERVLADVI